MRHFLRATLAIALLRARERASQAVLVAPRCCAHARAAHEPPARIRAVALAANRGHQVDVVRICTTCRHRTVDGSAREELRGTELLARVASLAEAIPVEGVAFVGQECLSACDRGCAVSFSGAGKWTYVFGGLDPQEAARDLLSCAALYRAAPHGFMERGARPERLRAGIVARVPPHEYCGKGDGRARSGG